jgi:hypothetical protein
MSFLTFMFGLCTLVWAGAILLHARHWGELHIPHMILGLLNLYAAVQCP